MARYRARLAAERRIRRIELQVPTDIADEIKVFARRRSASRTAVRSNARVKSLLDLVLGTVNAPRPRAINAEKLIDCVGGRDLDPAWRPHVEAFLAETSIELIHDLVLAGVFTFEELDRARRIWRIQDGRNIDWVREMADLELAGLAARRSADPR